MAHGTVEYVHATAEGGWRIADSRVSLDSVVFAYQQGRTPESIVDEFATLSEEQVYGAIAFYLRNKQEIEPYLSQQHEKWDKLAEDNEARHGQLLNRIRARRFGDLPF